MEFYWYIWTNQKSLFLVMWIALRMISHGAYISILYKFHLVREKPLKIANFYANRKKSICKEIPMELSALNFNFCLNGANISKEVIDVLVD